MVNERKRMKKNTGNKIGPIAESIEPRNEKDKHNVENIIAQNTHILNQLDIEKAKSIRTPDSPIADTRDYDNEATLQAACDLFMEKYGNQLEQKSSNENQYIGNAPWDASSDSGSFGIDLRRKTFVYNAKGINGGTMKHLFQLANLDWNSVLRFKPKPSKAKTDNLDTLESFAHSKGLTVDHFYEYEWSNTVDTWKDGSRVIEYPVYTGKRFRILSSPTDRPKVMSGKGTKVSWYGLEQALEKLIEDDTLPLVICNGETSVIASNFLLGLPTICTTAGEGYIPSDSLMEQFTSIFRTNISLIIIFDNDEAGKLGAINNLVRYESYGYSVTAYELQGCKGYDLGDFAKDNVGKFELIYDLDKLENILPVDKKKRSLKDFSNLLHNMGYKNVKYNLVTRRVEINGVPITDRIENEIYIGAKDLGYKITMKDVLASISTSKVSTPYHPVKDYFESLSDISDQDGENIIRILRDTIPTDIDDFGLPLKAFMAGLIARVYDPEFRNIALMLISNAQAVGKSSFLRWLCPKVNDSRGYFLEQSIDTKYGNRADLAQMFSQNLLWEIKEFQSSIYENSMAAVKELIDGGYREARVAYGRNSELYPVMTSFVGTANYSGVPLLPDRTGNIRFFCVEIIGKMDWERYTTEINLDRLWAYAYKLYKEGYHELIKDKNFQQIQASQNRKYEAENNYLDSILDFVTITGDESDKLTYRDLELILKDDLFRDSGSNSQKFIRMLRQAFVSESKIKFSNKTIKSRYHKRGDTKSTSKGITGIKLNDDIDPESFNTTGQYQASFGGKPPIKR